LVLTGTMNVAGAPQLGAPAFLLWTGCGDLEVGSTLSSDSDIDSDGGSADTEHLAAFWRGDDRALEAIYRRHARRLLGAARSLVGPAEAESVVQEVFVELIRNEELRRRFTGGSLSGWLAAITRHKSLDHLKRSGRAGAAGARAVAADGDGAADGSGAARAEASPEPRLEARDLLVRFLRDGVPSAQAEFFRRRFLDGRTQVEVAAELNVPRSTLEGWEHRLAEKLRRFIWESSR
jgi:RNA polymerase sigma-70 factor (ECF subfamily)